MKKKIAILFYICLIVPNSLMSTDIRGQSTDAVDNFQTESTSLEPILINLGPAVTQISTLNGYLADSEHYIFSRNTTPGELLAYDVDKNEITLQVSFTIGEDRSNSALSMIHIDDELYIGIRFEQRRLSLVRVNRKTGEFREAVNLHPANDASAMVLSPDERIFLGTSHQYNARVYEYNPITGDGRWIGSFQTQGRQGVRAIAASEDHVFVGVGLEAPDLWQYDRQTGTKLSIFPDELRSIWLDVNAVALHENWIAAGGRGPVSEPIVVLINREDPSIFHLVNHDWELVQSMTIGGDVVYFGSGEGVWQYDINSDELERISDLRCNRGLFYRDGVLHGTDGRRNIGWHNLETGELTVIDLGKDAGAREWSEPGQSMLYSDGTVYVGGHHVIGKHDIKGGTFSTMTISGEAKHMISVPTKQQSQRNHIYWGGYGSGNLYRFDPDLSQIDIVASAPEENNRPRAVAYDSIHGLVMMGTQSDRLGAGALTIYNIENNSTSIIDRPFSNHSVSAVTSLDGIAYIGSAQGRVDPGGVDARLAAWNPVSKEKLWEIEPVANNRRIRTLINYEKLIMGMTVEGFFFVVNSENGHLIHSERIFHESEPGRLEVKGDIIIAVSNNKIRRINPMTYNHELIIADLQSQWFHWPSAAIDDKGNIYALKHLDLIKIVPHPEKITLLNPSSLSTVSSRPTFTWEELPSVDAYRMQLTETNFSNILVDTLVTETQLILPEELSPGQSHRWRVRGVIMDKDKMVEGAWSDDVLFFTQSAIYVNSGNNIPQEFMLMQNHPNPFNPSTRIEYHIPKASHVTLEIFNVQGQRVTTIVNGRQNAGIHAVIFYANYLPSGMYFYRIQADDFTKVKKMTLVK